MFDKIIHMQNVKISKTKNNVSRTCFIFCTSNDPICQTDRFEWENICKSKKIQKTARKIIFLKDPTRSYYANGIDENINNIEKLTEFLKKETEGLEVTTVGSSAGGYLAILLSYLLPNVTKAISISGVFNIYEWTGANNTFHFKDMKQLTELVGTDKEKYFNLIPYLPNVRGDVFHFYAYKCKSDNLEINSLKGQTFNKFHIIPIKASLHGHYINSYNLIKLICSESKKTFNILNIQKVPVSDKRLSFSLRNVFEIIVDLFDKLIRHFKR